MFEVCEWLVFHRIDLFSVYHRLGTFQVQKNQVHYAYMLKLYNTLSRRLEDFSPLNKTEVGLYTCGPTVYNFVHIGNLRTYLFEDILRRVLQYDGYQVKQVMNITDVGHLTDDADNGEDKMEKGALREGKSAWEIATFYTEAFFQDIKALNILSANIICKATDHIPEQIAQVQALTDKGLTYETSDGIYFDTTKLADYGKLAQLDKQTLQAGARVPIGEKKNPHDFALWKFTPAGESRQMEWSAFGKMGFPGWHIECSAMSMKYLGEQFDIHCGGIDHIPVHHTNEIAQAEGITGKIPWVKYWLHGEFLQIGSEKMSKSGDNFITLQTVTEHGNSPLAYRYFLLQAHYRKQLQFSWEALIAAETGLNNLKKEIQKLDLTGPDDAKAEAEFKQAINEDLNTAESLALIWTYSKNKSIGQELITKFDQVLGLDLLLPVTEKKLTVTPAAQALLEERALARDQKDWAEADRLRIELTKLGYTVEDSSEGQNLK